MGHALEQHNGYEVALARQEFGLTQKAFAALLNTPVVHSAGLGAWASSVSTER